MSFTVLAIVWFGFWGFLWAMYFMLDGFDLGIGMIYPFIARNQSQRNMLINAIGPFWDGNEVWLITAGGVTFAAFPITYASMFSFLYTPLMLILFGLIIRGAAIELMNKGSELWEKIWRWAFSISSFAISLLFGVAFANLFRGLPIDQTGYHGSLVYLLNPYGIAGGLLFVVLFLLSGLLWAGQKTEGVFSEKAFSVANRVWYLVVVVFSLFLVFSHFETNLFSNYLSNPLLFLVPAISLLSLLLVMRFIKRKEAFKGFISISIMIFTTIFTGIIGMYPNLIPSSIDQSYSLTLYNSSASHYTLNIMFYIVIIFIPIVIAYQLFAYKLFSGTFDDNSEHY